MRLQLHPLGSLDIETMQIVVPGVAVRPSEHVQLPVVAHHRHVHSRLYFSVRLDLGPAPVANVEPTWVPNIPVQVVVVLAPSVRVAPKVVDLVPIRHSLAPRPRRRHVASRLHRLPDLLVRPVEVDVVHDGVFVAAAKQHQQLLALHHRVAGSRREGSSRSLNSYIPSKLSFFHS